MSEELKPSTALAVTNKQQTTSLASIIGNMEELKTFSLSIMKSGIIPTLSESSAMVVATVCWQEGITIIDFDRKYHMINNRPSIKSEVMVAGFRMAGGRYKIIQSDNDVCEIAFSISGNDLTIRKTLQEFKDNGVALGKDGKLKDNWAKYPQAMLFARCTSTGVRMLAPEVSFGMYTPEEMSDIDPREVEVSSAQPLTKDEVVARAGATQVSEPQGQKQSAPKKTTTKKQEPTKQKPEDAEVVTDAPKPVTDHKLIPGGKLAGTPWSFADVKTLQSGLNVSDDKVSPESKEHIRGLCEQRGWEIDKNEATGMFIITPPVDTEGEDLNG